MSWSEALRNAPWARRAGALAWALPALLGAGEERMSDAQAATYAQRALVLVAAGDRETALQRLSSHVFRGSKAPEREIVLFAIGVLQDRLGRVREAADTLRKLEKAFPQSLYLEAAQVVLAEEALDHKRLPEAEQRLKRVLASEQPVETKRRAQEMLLWALAEQDRAKEGLEILDTLHPLPSQEHPSERGLVAMFEVAAANSDRKRAEAFHREYLRTYKNGPLLPRVELDWGRVLGAAGQSRESAQALRAMIRDFPKSPEANEARLALATLMADGKLSDRIRRAFPAPERLIAELEGITTNSDPGRRALVLKLRLAVQASEWGRALALAQQYRSTFANGPEL